MKTRWAIGRALCAAAACIMTIATAAAVEFVREPAGPRIDQTLDVALPVATVWRHWSTQAGVQAWFAPEAKVELRVGGPYEMHFNPKAPAGEKGSEGTVVMAWVPEELLVFSWNAPTRFGRLRDEHTWVVVRLEKRGESTTRIHFTHYGFGAGAEWAQVHAYFKDAWAFVLKNYAGHAARGG
ncbi:MAG: SRPBCC domain-containing protein [Burkholderiales bacterium]|nr:SRPBCC domain-containing protein [Burkholderiales bacterium]